MDEAIAAQKRCVAVLDVLGRDHGDVSQRPCNRSIALRCHVRDITGSIGLSNVVMHLQC